MRFDSATASSGEWYSVSSARRNGSAPIGEFGNALRRGFPRADQDVRDQRGQRKGVQHVVAQVVERGDLRVRNRDDVPERMRNARCEAELQRLRDDCRRFHACVSTASGE